MSRTPSVYHRAPAMARPMCQRIESLPERAIEALEAAIIDTGTSVTRRRKRRVDDAQALDASREDEYGDTIPTADR